MQKSRTTVQRRRAAIVLAGTFVLGYSAGSPSANAASLAADEVSVAPMTAYEAIVSGKSVPPCEHEDGSGQKLPCLWNADTAGNGAGLSFVVTKRDGRLFYTYQSPKADKRFGGF